ncbi:amino acid adenylation domain-containing protein [Wangella sp. NEAU-J3]|nr:amino acid adenylation domain-containing protein [Jidongwangia harbinensis]MCA2211700.1 amino acid adenylation domain-containing protein [Jidongwangia harbinensis]
MLVDEVTAERFASMPYDLVDLPATLPADRQAGPGVIDPGIGDLAYVLFTSGSTGEPKGVAIEHRSVANLLDALDEVLPRPEPGRAERWLATANLCFDLSVVELFWPLTRGIPVVVAALESLTGRVQGGAAFLTETLTDGRITHFFVTPSLVQLLLRDRKLAAAIRRLRVLILGGEIVQPELVAQLRPVPHVFNLYGPTEGTVATTVHECTDRDVEYVPIGPPLRGIDVRVVNEDGVDCPAGEPGELLIGGAGLARGYLNDPELTARKFPVLGHGENRRRWYRSGDLASIGADGVVRFHGRIDHQVKVRGARVELSEIEAAIRSVPEVDEAVVLPIPDRSGRVTGLTAVAKSAAADLTGAAILAAISEILPWYAVPGTVIVVPDLPLAVSGKVDRQAVERRLPELAPAPAGG